jgi:hypothetical protein
VKRDLRLQMLFLRDYTCFAGGHLKYADYIRHTMACDGVDPVLYQTPRSHATADNIFREFADRAVDVLQPCPAYFIAGTDWFILDEAGIDTGAAPVINLIQDFRYADPTHPVHRCLRRPALRICVSDPLAAAVRDHANGEVCVIHNGMAPIATRGYPAGPPRVLVAGLKNPALAQAVAQRLDGLVAVDLVTQTLPRPDFLERMARATVCMLLPLPREGFYLPPLEAMALGRGVVTTDCEGNRTYCRHDGNCLIPAAIPDDLVAAALTLVRDAPRLQRLVEGGHETAALHSLDRERTAYHEVLDRYLRSVRP